MEHWTNFSSSIYSTRHPVVVKSVALACTHQLGGRRFPSLPPLHPSSCAQPQHEFLLTALEQSDPAPEYDSESMGARTT